MGTILSKDQILAARKLPRVRVPVPEWGGDVWVQVMTGTDRDAYECEIMRDKEATLQNMRAILAARCMVDDKGAPLFSVAEAVALGTDSWIPLDRVATAAQEINLMTDAALENIKGNSVPSPGAVES